MFLPPLTPSESSPAIRQALQALPKLGLFGVLAHAESAFAPWLAYGGALLSQLDLDPVLRELAILQVAHAEHCQYEWVQHLAIGAQAGVTPPQITAIETGQLDGGALGPRESLVVHAAREFVSDGRVSPPRVAGLIERLGARQTVELTLVLGQYLAVARIVASLAIPVDEDIRLADAGARSHDA